MRKVLCRVAPGLLAAGFAIEPRIVAGAIQRAIALVVGQRKPFVRAGRGKADHITIRPRAGGHPRAKLDQHTRGVLVGIGDIQRLVDFKVVEIAEPVRRIGDTRCAWPGGLGPRRHDGRGGHACRSYARAAQKLSAAGIDKFFASFTHAFLPTWRRLKTPGIR